MNPHDISRIEQAVSRALRGKPDVVRNALIALVAGGHLLIEDVPGVGKTTLARALAASVGGTFRRVQFTSDLLPSDILGVTVYDSTARTFEFKKGPIFANFVLADEINRTTPRTQSALLEVMSEGRVSVDGVTHEIERPFMVIATQNPLESYGTYPLPDSQLDRFLLRISVGYPSPDVERTLLQVGSPAEADVGAAVTELAALSELQRQVAEVNVDASLADYAMRVVEATRNAPEVAVGVSTRGALAWMRAAQSSALCNGRTYVTPDDFKSLAVMALAHRIVVTGGGPGRSAQFVRELVGRTPVPGAAG